MRNPLEGLTEAEFQSQVMVVARRFGWRVAHAGRAKVGGKWVTRMATGWPDLTLLRPPELVFLELKRTGGRIRPEQTVWVDELDTVAGVTAAIVGPDDAEWVWQLLSRRTSAR